VSLDDQDDDEAARIMAIVSKDQGKKRKHSEDAEAQQMIARTQRKRRLDDEDMEGNYFARLQAEEVLANNNASHTTDTPAPATSKVDGVAAVDQGDGCGGEDDFEGDGNIVHESLRTTSATDQLDKANRTAFISNVSTEVISLSKAKKTLMAHLSSILDKSASPPQTIESIRFRSTAFASPGVPKRLSFAQGSVMDATTNSTNAYVVYSTPAAVRAAVNKLNGTVVLDRHLRVDSVAHPAPQDHKRCVFVGNLGFINDETIVETTQDEEGKEVTQTRKRRKHPMDVEEGLWRAFGKDGRQVESVRVVRDPATRVGKGIAYVQFYVRNVVAWSQERIRALTITDRS
jgi:nucleolar protein 12